MGGGLQGVGWCEEVGGGMDEGMEGALGMRGNLAMGMGGFFGIY